VSFLFVLVLSNDNPKKSKIRVVTRKKRNGGKSMDKRFLKMNLQHFSEGGNDPQDPPTDPPADPPAGEKTIPYERFKQVNDKAKQYEETFSELGIEGLDALKTLLEDYNSKKDIGTQLEQLQADLNTKTQSEQTLTEQLETLKTKSTEYSDMINGMLEAKMNTIPEEFQELVPSNLDTKEKLAWIEKAQEKGLLKSQTEIPVGGSTNPKPSGNIDLNKLSPIQMLSNGYGKRK
jgi:hypothetical protein